MANYKAHITQPLKSRRDLRLQTLLARPATEENSPESKKGTGFCKPVPLLNS
jgi:hypothetical protein